MGIYRKKPVEIEARQITRESIYEVAAWANNTKVDVNLVDIIYRADDTPSGLLVWTLEGKMSAKMGDYLIKGVKGEFYACDEEIFNMTYELVKEDIPVLGGEYDYYD